MLRQIAERLALGRLPGVSVGVVTIASVLFMGLLTVSPETAMVTPTAHASPAVACATSDKALQHMHSHNDYGYHNTPLCTALGKGATSAEADVWFNSSTLQLDVKHGQTDSSPGTLEQLYLDPLWALYNQRPAGAKWLYPNWQRPFTLVVEIKDAGNQQALNSLQIELGSYLPMLTTAANGRVNDNMVTVLLTGNAGTGDVKQSPVQDTFVNLTDNGFLGGYQNGNLPPLSIAPLVNVPWCDVEGYLKAHVSGYEPTCAKAEEQDAWHYLDALNLQTYQAIAHELASLAHSRGLKIRWWGVPDELDEPAGAVNISYPINEVLNDLDYVSANSSEDTSALTDIDSVASVLNSLGDGCSGAQECAQGAKALVSINSSGSQLQVDGTLVATDPGQCASLDVNFFLPSHMIERTVHIPQVCSTTLKRWGITVPGAPSSYAAVGTDLHSTELTHGGTQTTHDFYYLSTTGTTTGSEELTNTTPAGLACKSGDPWLTYSYAVETTGGATVDGLVCEDHVTTGVYWAVRVADTAADGKCTHGVASWFDNKGTRSDNFGMYVCGFGNVSYFDTPVRNWTLYKSTELGAFIDAGPSSYAPLCSLSDDN